MKRSKKKNKGRQKACPYFIRKHINKQSQKIQKFVKTTDNWCPNYPGDTVRVFLLNQKTEHKEFNFVRIAVWGADDFGLEMDFKGTEEENDSKFIEWKENIYDKIPEPCTEQWFRNVGFCDA